MTWKKHMLKKHHRFRQKRREIRMCNKYLIIIIIIIIIIITLMITITRIIRIMIITVMVMIIPADRSIKTASQNNHTRRTPRGKQQQNRARIDFCSSPQQYFRDAQRNSKLSTSSQDKTRRREEKSKKKVSRLMRCEIFVMDHRCWRQRSV